MSICSLADKSRMSTGVSPLTERTAGSGISTRASQQSGTGTPFPSVVQSSPSASGLECVFRSRSSPDPVLGVILSTSEKEGRENKKPAVKAVERHGGTGPSHRVAQLERGFIGDGGCVSHLARPEAKAKKQAKLHGSLARCSRLPLPVLGQPMSAPAHCPLSRGVWAIRIDSNPLSPR